MHVDIKRVEPSRTIGTVALVDGHLQASDSVRFVLTLKPIDREGRAEVTEPERFLRALPRYLTNGYVEAVLVE